MQTRKTVGAAFPPLLRAGAIDRRMLILLAISAMVTLVWGLTRPLTYTTDSTTYVELAQYLLGQREPHPIVFIRPPGYPLLLILTGVIAFHSFVGLLLAQALTAVAIPLIAYKTVAHYSRSAAFAAGLLITLSLMPQIYSRAVMTEQPFIFGFVLLAYLVVRYSIERSTKLFWSITITTIGLAFLRPSANLFGYIIVAATLLLEPRQWRRALSGVLIIFAVTGAWASFAAGEADPHLGGNLVSRFFSGAQSFAGEQLFYDAYVVGEFTPPPGILERRLTFAASNGPASARLLQTLMTFAELYPQFWKTHPLAHPGDDAASFVDRLRTRPSQMAFGFMWSATDTMLGPAESARLFRDAAVESFRVRPTVLLGLLDNFVSVLFGPVAAYSSGVRVVMIPTLDAVTFHDPGLGALGDSVRPYLALPKLASWWERDPTSYFYGFGYTLLKPALTVTVIMTLLFMAAGPMRWPALVLTATILCHHAITAVFAEPYARYVDQVLPATVVLAAMGVVAASRGLRQGGGSQGP